MNTTQAKQKTTSWRLARWLVAIVGLPILAITALAVWVASREFQAQREYERLIAPLRLAGYPLGDAWAERTFREHTHEDGTAAWSKILMLSTALDDEYAAKLPIVGSGTKLPILDPSQAWPDNPSVGEFLKEARPLIDLVHAASDYQTPVWQPLSFNGYATLLHETQQSRAVVRLLQLDAEHALYNDDAPRAMAAIKSMQKTAQAFDWDMFLVGELVNHALRGILYETIQRSLSASRWDEQQLETLVSLVNTPILVSEKWQASLKSEQAMVASFIENSADTLPELTMFRFPSAKLNLMRAYEDVRNLGSSSSYELSRRAEAYEHQLSDKLTKPLSLDMILVGHLFPAISSYARSFKIVEDNRRMTLTAVAIKRFQLVHDRWPNALAELTEFGLSPSDWTIPEVGSFGYDVQGETAAIWGVGADEEVFADRPQLETAELSQGVTADGFAIPTLIFIR